MKTTVTTWDGPLSVESIAQELRKSLFGSLGVQVTPEALRAEVLRVALWELSVLSLPGSMAKAVVSTRKILHRARILFEPLKIFTSSSSIQSSSDPLNKDVEESLSRESLETLAEQGDIQSYSGGWLPAPLRFVPLMNNHMLVVGGMPTALLPDSLSSHLQLHGSLRQCKADSVSAVLDKKGTRQFQSAESWLGSPAISLSELLRRFQTIELSPVEVSSSFSLFDVYLPTSSSTGRFHFSRWQSAGRVTLDGRYLLRSRNLWGGNEYTIGLFKQRELKAQSMIGPDLEIRRLCYALDAQANAPTSAMWDPARGILTLYSELPMRERKYLATVGRLKKNSDGNYYPRVWQIPLSAAAQIRELLTDLKIDI